MPDISIDEEKCTLCQACTEICPLHIFFMEASKVQVQHQEQCTACSHCVSVCPEDAVIHKGLDLAGFLPIPKDTGLSPQAMYYFLRSRRSCRVYSSKPVPRDMVE